MTISRLITGAFHHAASRQVELHKTWIVISHRVGSQLPNSLLSSSIQSAGQLDMVLRCMEDDFIPPGTAPEADPFAPHYQILLSVLWVGAVYEVVRLVDERKLMARGEEFTTLAHDLRLLRIPLEKHEIAGDKKLSEPLLMQSFPPKEGETDVSHYSASDARKAHIMPSRISSRGSIEWQVIDVRSMRSYWLERRALSDRIIALWAPEQPA